MFSKNYQTHTKILGHRGYSGVAPENTHLSFQTAVGFGFNGFEIDVHLTKDQQLVVIHDETTKRTSLVDKKIQNSTLEELKQLDQAKFFKINTPKQEIMTLKELLDEFLSQIEYLNIEIKTDIIQYDGIEEALNDLVSQYDTAYQKIIFSSFNFKSLQKMHQLNNKWVNGFLWWTKKQFRSVETSELQKVCRYLHPWTKIYDLDKETYYKLNMPFNLWTINSKSNYEKYLHDSHVKFLISNHKF